MRHKCTDVSDRLSNLNIYAGSSEKVTLHLSTWFHILEEGNIPDDAVCYIFFIYLVIFKTMNFALCIVWFVLRHCKHLGKEIGRKVKRLVVEELERVWKEAAVT